MKPISKQYLEQDKLVPVELMRLMAILDRWQATVEERLYEIEQHPALQKARDCGCPTQYPCDCPEVVLRSRKERNT